MDKDTSRNSTDERITALIRVLSPGDQVHARLYPEYAAGHFTPDAHFFDYYNRINSLIDRESTVLNFGAGRGKHSETLSGWKLELCSLRGRCARLVGVDVDPVVLSNPMTDENHVIGPDGTIPLPNASVDLITSWAVLEHVANPGITAQELDRVLRPGGWLCAWTPNKWGYIGIVARLVPNGFHASILRKIGIYGHGDRDDDVFPVCYKMNTRSVLKRLFPVDRYEHHVALRNGPPSYHGGNTALARLIWLYCLAMPPAGRATLHIFIRKKS